MPAAPFHPFESLDLDRVIYDLNDIRQVNPQRDSMEQLTAIVHIDRENNSIVGYKDISEREFWATGHFPGFPLMPGVIMCEAAAQLSGFYARKFDMMGGDFLGFGGMDDVRFRLPIRPPCRLVIMSRMKRIPAGRRAEFEFQGYVDEKLAYNGLMIGVPINRDHAI